MEQREIEIFLTLASELHFGRTAERLHVSTARVSQALKKLERQVGVPLFDRSSRQVALTPIGRRLYDDLGPAYAAIQQGIARAIAAGRAVEGVLRVGFIGAAAGQFVLEAGEIFGTRHPDCEVEIRESQFSDGHHLLADDDIDMLLCAFQPAEPGYVVGPVLFREDRLLAVSIRHPFARLDSISFADIARTRLLRTPSGLPDELDASLGPRSTADGRPVERGPVFSTVQELLALVGAGKGTYPVPTQAPQYYARPDVAYVPIRDSPPFDWSFVWRATAETARIRAFHEAAQSVTNSSTGLV